jgi:hypothetical protein
VDPDPDRPSQREAREKSHPIAPYQRPLWGGRIATAAATRDNRAQIAKLEREAASLVEAIATCMLRTSPAIAKRLAATEETLAQLRAQPPPRSV